jgi:tetratricopeptide (TPR) repeat protein
MEATGHQVAGRLHEARAIYDELIAANPDDANALHQLGILFHQAGNHAMAIELVEKALEKMPDFPLFLNNHGHLCLAANLLDKAEDSLLKATRLKPDEAEPLYGLGECYRRRGELQRAANVIEQVLERIPGHMDAIVTMAQIHYTDQAHDRAIECCDVVLELDPEHFDARFHKSRALYAVQEYDKSAEILQGLLESQPDNAACHNNLGNAYMALGRYQDAVQAYQEVVDRRPDDADLRYNLAVALAQTADLDSAEEQFEKVLETVPLHERASKMLESVRAAGTGESARGETKKHS